MANTKEQDIKVSVIMPVYNMGDDLRESVGSVLGQSLHEIELICVDDGSTDDSVAVLNEIGANDDRLVVISQENSGAGVARNNALARARGKYVAFMDADDAYPSKYVLEKLVEAAENHGVKIAGGSKLIKSPNGVKRKKDQTFTAEEVIEYKDFQKDYDYQCYIYDLQMLRDNGIDFPYYRRYQDPPFFIGAMIAAGKFCAIPDDTYLYTRDPGHVKWNEEKTVHLIRAITECLELSAGSGLAQLHYRTVKRLEKDYKERITGNCSRAVIEALFEAEKKIDSGLMKAAGGKLANFDGEYRLRLIDDMIDVIRAGDYQDIKKELKKIKAGRAYRILRRLGRG